ncbi:MAG: hypothetical protein KIT85_19345 [Pseudolabrys sp.]|nr:hypothetical protein [Pseudolabrys sp.]
MSNYMGEVRMFGKTYISTTDFEFWMSQAKGSEKDFFVLQEAVQNKRTKLPYLIEIQSNNIWVRHMSGRMVLVLTVKSRASFLKLLDHTCSLIRQ